jgi:hypothetical protein
LEATLRLRDAVFASQTHAVRVGRGERALQDIVFDVPEGTPVGVARLDYVLTDARGRKLDQRRIPFRVAKRIERSKRLESKSIVVVGPGCLSAWLTQAGVTFAQVSEVTPEAVAKARVVVMEPHTVVPGSDQLPVLRDYVRAGGAVVLLEQDHSLFHGVSVVPHSSWLATRAASDHAVFAGLTDDDLVCWDNRPVAGTVYRKDERLRSLADGDGGAVVIEVADGKGIVLATQLRIPVVLDVTPAAGQLLLNLLTPAATHRGHAPESSCLAGDFTPVPAHEGKGYPETFWMRNSTTSATVAAQLVAATLRANADYPPVQVFGVGDRWETVHRTNGWASAAASSLASPIYLYCRFYAQVASSSFRIEGAGTVEVTVGGQTYSATLQADGTRIDGIALQKGYNAVLVLWKPVSGDSRFRGVWCDEQDNPQTAFAFV